MRAGRILLWLVVVVLGIPAVLITLARASGLESGLIIRLVSFTPLGIPLWAALVVLLLVASVVRERGTRTPLLAATLVALVALAAHLWWFSSQMLGTQPQPAENAPTMTIMNANLYVGQADARDIVAAVRRYHVDILATEEITPDEVEALDAAGLSTVLPHRAGRADPQVSGTMIFANTPISDVVDLHTDFQSYEVSVGGLRLIVAHPLSPEYPSGWVADHQRIREAAVRDHVDAIVGDLNATPDHTVLRELGDAGYRDVAEEANEGWQPTWPANHLGVPGFVPPLVRIDHVLVASTLAGLGTQTVHIDDTDHLALVARVALR